MTYTGEVSLDLKACGYGISVLSDGTIFEGTFFDDLFEGFVIRKDPKGKLSVLSYKEGWKHGLSTCYWEGGI